MNKALLVVDLQKDFVEGGSLAVAGGLDVAVKVEHLLRDNFEDYFHVLATKDWHNRAGDNGGHFHDNPDYADTWPSHCVAGTAGSEFARLDPLYFNEVFHKGWNVPAYSGFQGTGERHHQTLEEFLDDHGVTDLDVCGIATDYCVKATVLDALDRGYNVRVLSDLTTAVGDKQAALDEMAAFGAIIL